jgi:hypothetical protein
MNKEIKNYKEDRLVDDKWTTLKTYLRWKKGSLMSNIYYPAYSLGHEVKQIDNILKKMKEIEDEIVDMYK